MSTYDIEAQIRLLTRFERYCGGVKVAGGFLVFAGGAASINLLFGNGELGLGMAIVCLFVGGGLFEGARSTQNKLFRERIWFEAQLSKLRYGPPHSETTPKPELEGGPPRVPHGAVVSIAGTPAQPMTWSRLVADLQQIEKRDAAVQALGIAAASAIESASVKGRLIDFLANDASSAETYVGLSKIAAAAAKSARRSSGDEHFWYSAVALLCQGHAGMLERGTAQQALYEDLRHLLPEYTGS